MTEVNRVVRGTVSEGVCRFMDGPFQFSVAESDEGLLHGAGRERRMAAGCVPASVCVW